MERSERDENEITSDLYKEPARNEELSEQRAEQTEQSKLTEQPEQEATLAEHSQHPKGEPEEDLHPTGQSESTKKAKSETWEWIKALGIAVIIAVAIRMFLFAPIVVDGTSMVPTLQHNERLIVNKAIYFISEPKRGDILVFHAEMDKDWIKRVIGEPGDIVEIRNDELYINGELVDEPYLKESKLAASGPLTNDFYEEVPQGHIFVMGDNRQNSRDSRSIGSVPIDSVVGRADIVFWPLSEFHFVNKK